jgi:timeless
MDLLNNPQIHSTFASIGSMQGEVYVPTDNCLAVLEEINFKLSMEDTTLRTYRRAIGFGQNVKKDIMPLLMNMKEPKIIDSAVRLMLNLTVPIEYLFSIAAMGRTEIGRHTIYDLHRLLLSCKEAFSNFKATKAIIDHMNATLDVDGGKLSLSSCESINNCILLLRNILHISENVSSSSQHHQHNSMQNQIIWNLFTLNIDKLLLQLMQNPLNSSWGVNIVQVIALMYKDQHVGNLQKLLHHWVESSALTDSSDDNESNTSPQKTCCDSSPLLTSTDPTTSDSSDNGSGKITVGSNSMVDASIQITSRNKSKKCLSDESFDSAQSSMNSDNLEYFNHDVPMKVNKRIIFSFREHTIEIKLKNKNLNLLFSHRVSIQFLRAL